MAEVDDVVLHMFEGFRVVLIHVLLKVAIVVMNQQVHIYSWLRHDRLHHLALLGSEFVPNVLKTQDQIHGSTT